MMLDLSEIGDNEHAEFNLTLKMMKFKLIIELINLIVMEAQVTGD